MGTTAHAPVSNAQKEIERRHLHSFRHLCPDFPAGELIEGETPDFIVVTPSGQKIGIEHTQVFKKDRADGTAEQADETTKDCITAAAIRRAEALRLPPAHVSLFFNPLYLKLRMGGAKLRSFTKAQRQKIGEGIADFVGHNMPPQGSWVRLDWRPGQPRQVDYIHINRVHPVDHHDWSWMGTEFNAIQDDAIERMQVAITNKLAKYKYCLRKCDECWLLVVAHSFRSSGTIHPSDASLAHIYISPYSQIYFLDFGLGRVSSLNTEPRP